MQPTAATRFRRTRASLPPLMDSASGRSPRYGRAAHSAVRANARARAPRSNCFLSCFVPREKSLSEAASARASGRWVGASHHPPAGCRSSDATQRIRKRGPGWFWIGSRSCPPLIAGRHGGPVPALRIRRRSRPSSTGLDRGQSWTTTFRFRILRAKIENWGIRTGCWVVSCASGQSSQLARAGHKPFGALPRSVVLRHHRIAERRGSSRVAGQAAFQTRLQKYRRKLLSESCSMSIQVA
jgi:hypothetical protein